LKAHVLRSRRPERWWKACLAIAVLAGLTGVGAEATAATKNATDKSPALETIQKKLEKAQSQKSALDQRKRELARDAASLRRKMINSARTTQEREAILSQLETQLVELETDAQRRQKALSAQRHNYAGTMNALGRLSRTRPEVLLFTPGKPIDNVRSAMLLRIAIPQLKDRAHDLAAEIENLARVKRDIEGKVGRLRKADDSLGQERKRLRSLLTKKRALQRKTEAQRAKVRGAMKRLTRKAKNLRDLVARLNAARETIAKKPLSGSVAPATSPDGATTSAPTASVALSAPKMPRGLRTFPDKGPLTTPIIGRLVGRFGDRTQFGNTLNGIQLQGRRDGQVIAPFDGKVVFSGPFRNYGQILIIEHRGGYHTVLAGLSRIDATVGQWLLAGEPVGVLAARSQGKPTLYVELRHNGQPINPAPWIVARTGKVRG
jgi:septal ring factor EnvC (AmiA/AmiB activator)